MPFERMFWYATRVLHALCCALLLSLHSAHAGNDDPYRMFYLQTKDLQLIYYPTLEYLVPYATSTFANSHAWQRRNFGWTPSQRTGIFLKDFADYGGAAAWAAPFNSVSIDVAPPSLAFESSSAAERMYSTMNHELVHVATNDVASRDDLFWRGAFLGKVSPQAQNPESLLYSYLTVPRFTAPRWYLEGAAVFFETWMGGGLGRAQGGYDEMVFRAMVRDGARFYDPLGLVSRGVLVDFQVGVNAYLYGTRFITWLAHTLSARQGGRPGCGATKAASGITPTSFSLSLASHSTPHGMSGSPSKASSSAPTSSACARIRSRRTACSAAPRSVRSRALISMRRAACSTALSAHPACRSMSARSTRATAATASSAISGAARCTASLRFGFDAERGTAFFTDRNQAFRDLVSFGRRRRAKSKIVFPNCAHWRARRQPT